MIERDASNRPNLEESIRESENTIDAQKHVPGFRKNLIKLFKENTLPNNSGEVGSSEISFAINQESELGEETKVVITSDVPAKYIASVANPLFSIAIEGSEEKLIVDRNRALVVGKDTYRLANENEINYYESLSSACNPSKNY